MEEIIELCLPLVHNEERQNAGPGCVWNRLPRPRAPAGAPRFLPRAQGGEVGLGHFVLPEHRCAQAGALQKTSLGFVAPFPAGALSPMASPRAVDARGAQRTGARDAKPRASPQRSLEHTAFTGRGHVGDWAPWRSRLIPPWQTSLSRYCSEPSPGSAFRADIKPWNSYPCLACLLTTPHRLQCPRASGAVGKPDLGALNLQPFRDLDTAISQSPAQAHFGFTC